MILNDKICVKKGHAQGFGQQHPQGALAHTGHADENDVVHGALSLSVFGDSLSIPPEELKGKRKNPVAKSQITEATPPPARAETAGIQIRRRFPWGEVRRR